MSAEENIKLREYRDLIEIIAKVEYQKFSRSHLIELPELINIGTHALYILFKNHDPESYNSTYLSTAIKWAIRNEVRRRYKWYTLKNKSTSVEDEDYETKQPVIGGIIVRDYNDIPSNFRRQTGCRVFGHHRQADGHPKLRICI